MPTTNENTKQIKSRQRVADHGEVFTNPREVNAMLNLVRDESFRLDSRFLEPACGDGNFLIEILRRKLSLLKDIKSQTEWEFKSLIAVGSCYGIDILPDNAEACRTRLEEYVLSQHPALERLNAHCAINAIQAAKPRSMVLEHSVATEPHSVVEETHAPCGHLEEMRQEPYLLSLRYMLQKNIVCGDALTYRTAEGKPITFCEWTPIAGGMQFSRRDFHFPDFVIASPRSFRQIVFRWVCDAS